MSLTPSYPGVYLEELPSGVKGIVGVSTSVTAFVGFLTRGPALPVEIYNFGDFQRYFGGLDPASETSYAVSQYFTNGGGVAIICRVQGTGTATASVQVAAPPTSQGGSYGGAVVTISAANAGSWGNSVYVVIDYNTVSPATLFNLTASEWATVNGQMSIVGTTVVQGVSMSGTGTQSAVGALANLPNPLVQLASANSSTANPAASGAYGTQITTPTSLTGQTMQVTLTNGGTTSPAYTVTMGTVNTIGDVAPQLQAAMLAVPQLVDAQVTAIGSAVQIRLTSLANALTFMTFSGALATSLGITGQSNVQAYQIGSTATTQAQSGGFAGADGTAPTTATSLIGSLPSRTGIYSLEYVDIFNILCLPDLFTMTTSAGGPAITAASNYCMARLAFLIVDLPSTVISVQGAQSWILGASAYAAPSAGGQFSAAYFPAVQIPDPLNNYNLRPSAPSGTLAGVYGVTDVTSGVWKAPAGVNATLRGVTSLAYQLTDAENGALNPLGLNALRTLPVYGTLSWGARTLAGADQLQSDWKYVPVRRLALFIEASLVRGLQWVVFEPNGEVLWSQIRLNVSVFMQRLFLNGAFAGVTPSQAYFVQCDASTTSAQDQAAGIVNILVGFAPLRPAEFVIISLQQMAGQAAT